MEDDVTSPVEQRRRTAIHAAAIGEFSANGFAATSMAKIAASAGMSRPALYQYFRNKGDLFASAFIAMFDEHVDQALAALDEPGSMAEQLDGFLQRYEGDLWERMDASPHLDEISSVKNDHVSDAVRDAVARLWVGLETHLAGLDRQTRTDVADLVRFAPKGFRSDEPTVSTYRRRLSALARSVAAEIADD